MFSPNLYIDTFQNTKRIITNAVIVDQVLNKAANDYIDSQTQFAKTLVQNTISLARYSAESYTKVMFPTKEGTA